MRLTKQQLNALKMTGVKYSDAERDRTAYSSDASQASIKPPLIFWPEEKKQVHKLVNACYENNVPITPRGAGTGLSGGAVPTGIVIDLSMLRDVHVLASEKKAIVGPGTVLADLNRAAGKKGLMFPIVPSSEKVCTIGGMINTNAVGLRAVKYGRTSDWVRELTLVDGKGELKKLSGEKAKEFCGTEGTLGVLVEAVLNLAEKALEKSMSLEQYDDVKSVISRVIQEKENASFLEYICPISAKLAGLPEKHHLMIGYLDDSGLETDPEKIEAMVRLREALGPVRAAAGYTIIEDPQVPISHLSEIINWLNKHEIPTVGHLGVGILHPRFSDENKHLIPKLHELVKSVGGLASGEHGYGLKKVKYVPEEHKQRLLRLKKEYDPKGIMNPGKVICGKNAGNSGAVSGCVQCGLCKTCPVYITELNESTGSRGRAILYDKSDDLEAFYSCTLCMACDQECPTGLVLSEKILEKRKELVDKGRETEANKKMIENVRKYGNPFGEVSSQTKEWYCC